MGLWGAVTAALAALVLLALPHGAQAAVTIGSNLGRAPDPSFGGTCTHAHGPLDAGRQAAGGLTSPVNGTVVRWRIRAGGETAAVPLRVIRPLGANLFTGAGTSATVTPALNSISTFATSLPISIGDRIGIDCPLFARPFYATAPLPSTIGWSPPLAHAGPGRAPNIASAGELLLNADVEPFNSFSLGRVKRNRKRGTARIRVEAPNAGLLRLRGRGLRPARRRIARAGAVWLPVRPRAAARRALRRRGAARVRFRVRFLPDFGSTATQRRRSLGLVRR